MQRPSRGVPKFRGKVPSARSKRGNSQFIPDDAPFQTENPAGISKSSTAGIHPQLRVFETDLGWFGFQGSERGMTALTFGHACRDDVYDRLCFESLWNLPSSDEAEESGFQSLPAIPPPPHWMQQAEELLMAYAAGEPIDLSAIPCDLPFGTRFEQRVREQLAKVGYGQTITYGQLAEAAGAPRAARAVGSVMARNQIPLVIACHRVVAAAGKLGGYSAPSGLTMKERLLQLEQGEVIAPMS